jgi:formylglycine-generating enzyme required for sulfatase activity
MGMLQAKLNSFLDSLKSPEDWLILADFLEEQDLSAEAELVRCQRRLRNNPEDSQARRLEERLLTTGVRPPVFVNSQGMKLARVPAGTFWMGGGGGKAGDKQVEIAADFYLGIHLVTQEQWQALMGSNPSFFSRSGDGKDKVKRISDAELNQFPVESVSWEDAQEFIQRLNAREGTGEWTYRLPTDAEWEYACRGGATSQQDCSYHFYFDQPTNDLSSTQANFDGNFPVGSGAEGPYLQRTTKVGTYRPNRLGLFDMHGNVWEWCEDLYDEGPCRVDRGGSWSYPAESCRATGRGSYGPAGSSFGPGLRLARVPVK